MLVGVVALKLVSLLFLLFLVSQLLLLLAYQSNKFKLTRLNQLRLRLETGTSCYLYVKFILVKRTDNYR